MANWDPNSPGSVTLYLRITEDTYNTAIAAPYNVNADALKMLRDNGILGNWETHSEWTNCSTLNDAYHSDDVDITFAGNHYVCVDEPMTVTSKNGKNIYRAVIHIGEYYKEWTNLTYVKRGNAIISDDALTVTVTNINSNSFTFNFSGASYEFVPVESVELCYAGSGQNVSYVTVNTTPDADNCYGHTMTYDYRDHTYTLNFTSANPHHTLMGEPDWHLTDDGVNVSMTATTHCTVCGEELHLNVESYSSGTRKATYTKERTKLIHFLAQTDQWYYYDYEQVLGPKLPVTTHSIEDGNGNILEYYEDESAGKYYIDLDGPAIALENIRIPETKIDAVPAADEADGNIEYYSCSNGRTFKLEDGKYVEIKRNAWISHIGEPEVIDTTMQRGKLVFTGQNVKVTADDIHINVNGGYSRDYTPIGDSGDVFMFGNLSASEVSVYGDVKTEVAVGDCTVTGFDSSKIGRSVVAVTYETETAIYTGTFTVAIAAPATITSVSLAAKPSKLSYLEGEEFASAGLIIKVKYSDGRTVLLSEGYTVEGFDSLRAGNQILTVSYGGYSTQFTVTVSSVSIVAIGVATKPAKLIYASGDDFATAGLTLKVKYSDGRIAFIDDGFTVNGFDAANSGRQSVTCSYGGLTTGAFTVKVVG